MRHEETGLASIQLATTWMQRLKGLLFYQDFEGLLLLAPCRAIHTWGMKRGIDVAFLDAQGFVVSSYCNLDPRRHAECLDACAVLERFSNDEPWFAPGDRVALALLGGVRS